MIHFRSRKYGSHIDSSYFLKDGADMVDLSTFLVGDRVQISWPCSKDKCNALGSLNPSRMSQRFYATDIYTDNARIHTPCIVAERSRHLARHKGDMLDLRDYGLTITLEAEDGYVEDMLLWIMLGEKPTWADDEEGG